MKNLKRETRISTFLSASDLRNEILAAKIPKVLQKKKKKVLKLNADGEPVTERDMTPELEEPTIPPEGAHMLRRRYLETGSSEINPFHPLCQA